MRQHLILTTNQISYPPRPARSSKSPRAPGARTKSPRAPGARTPRLRARLWDQGDGSDPAARRECPRAVWLRASRIAKNACSPRLRSAVCGARIPYPHSIFHTPPSPGLPWLLVASGSGSQGVSASPSRSRLSPVPQRTVRALPGGWHIMSERHPASPRPRRPWAAKNKKRTPLLTASRYVTGYGHGEWRAMRNAQWQIANNKQVPGSMVRGGKGGGGGPNNNAHAPRRQCGDASRQSQCRSRHSRQIDGRLLFLRLQARSTA
jgi:hypothetical protein